jgi:uncharacterized protein YecT (DUF1311 family)
MLLALMVAIWVQPGDVRPDCNGNTLEINACLAERLDRANGRLEEYQQAAVDRYLADENDGDAIIVGIEASQRAFEAYRAIECTTVLEVWKGGTIRTAMYLGCLIRLTDERTHTIWRNWLRYMDSTSPLRPEPTATE